MSIPMTAGEVLNREFLEMRAKMLELAASFDRLDRAAGSVDDDARMQKLRKSLAILNQAEPGRAAELQQLFSLPYDPDWQQVFAEQSSQRAKSAAS